MTAEPASAAEPFWTQLGYFRPVFDYLRSHGITLTPFLQLMGLKEADLVDADRRIPNEVSSQVLALARDTLQDPDIGLKMSQCMQMQHMGIMGLLVMSCRTAREAFELHTRYQSLVGNGLETVYTPRNGELCMEVTTPAGHPPMTRQDYDFSLAGWLKLKKQLVGDNYAPLRIEFPYPAPENTAALQACFQAPLSFGHPVMRIFYPLHYLDIPLLAADPQLKQVLETQARKRLQELQGEQADTDPQLAQVRKLIAGGLAYGVPSLEKIATAMGISVRTLQRQLDSRDSSFKLLLDQVRCDLAGKYIENPDLSLLDVAMMLGFAEQSSFARAFKRWFGDAPGAYRKQVMAA